MLQGIVTDHGAVIFNGDGYSEAWHEEAAQRGLPNLRTTPDALPELADPAVIAMLDKYKVLSPRELNSRYEVYLEQYILSVHVEAVETARVGKTAILPAALRYQALLADNVAKLTAVDIPATWLWSIGLPAALIPAQVTGCLLPERKWNNPGLRSGGS